jgi:hypothetical protein
MTPWQRNVIALARGVKWVRGTMTYDCKIDLLKGGWLRVIGRTISVKADYPLEAAREAAAKLAAELYPNGQPGFVTEQKDGTFLAVIGQQTRSDCGIATRGVTISIKVKANAPASYRNSSFPERQCDYCGKPYRGPAVYCSLECATDDL